MGQWLIVSANFQWRQYLILRNLAILTGEIGIKYLDKSFYIHAVQIGLGHPAPEGLTTEEC